MDVRDEQDPGDLKATRAAAPRSQRGTRSRRAEEDGQPRTEVQNREIKVEGGKQNSRKMNRTSGPVAEQEVSSQQSKHTAGAEEEPAGARTHIYPPSSLTAAP